MLNTEKLPLDEKIKIYQEEEVRILYVFVYSLTVLFALWMVHVIVVGSFFSPFKPSNYLNSPLLTVIAYSSGFLVLLAGLMYPLPVLIISSKTKSLKGKNLQRREKWQIIIAELILFFLPFAMLAPLILLWYKVKSNYFIGLMLLVIGIILVAIVVKILKSKVRFFKTPKLDKLAQSEVERVEIPELERGRINSIAGAILVNIISIAAIGFVIIFWYKSNLHTIVALTFILFCVYLIKFNFSSLRSNLKFFQHFERTIMDRLPIMDDGIYLRIQKTGKERFYIIIAMILGGFILYLLYSLLKISPIIDNYLRDIDIMPFVNISLIFFFIVALLAAIGTIVYFVRLVLLIDYKNLTKIVSEENKLEVEEKIA